VLAVRASDIRIGYGISSRSGSIGTTSAATTPAADGSVVDHQRFQVVGDAQAGRQWHASWCLRTDFDLSNLCRHD
jgi:hypothetical protein